MPKFTPLGVSAVIALSCVCVESACAQETAMKDVDAVFNGQSSTVVPDSIQNDCVPCESAYESIWTRRTLTGDWHGYRSRLQDSGVTFRGRATQYAFGIAGGIDQPVPAPFGQGDTFKYTGHNEYDLIFDLEKFGGMPKGKLLVRAEHWYGDFGNVSFHSGTLTPPVFAAFAPPLATGEGVLSLTNFVITQPISSRLVVFAGKKDVLGDTDQDFFAGGDGTEQFINQAIIANPTFLTSLPYTSFVAGLATPRSWGGTAMFVRDPQDRSKDFFKLNDLFSEGVIVGGEVKVKTNFFDKPGEHHVGGIWKHLDQIDLGSSASFPGQIPFTQNQATQPMLGRKSDAYTIYYGFDQFLQVYSGEPRRGWGLFGRASISDGNPTPVRYFLSGGIGGDSPVRCRHGDKFGIGWYFVGTSQEFGPLSQSLFGPREAWGVECYYNFQATPWLNISPDFQFLRPGIGRVADSAFVYGLRVSMKL